MNKNNKIQITVQPGGQLQIEAVDFHGPDCERATAFIELALGRLLVRHKKPEYFRRAQNRSYQKLGQ